MLYKNVSDRERGSAAITSLSAAVADLVHDGDTVALEGFTHLIPVAAGHELIRQRRRDLTLVRMTPDIVYDQLIGAGCARKLDLLVGRQPGRRLAAPLPRRDPERLAARRSRSRSTATPGSPTATSPPPPGLPFAVMRGYRGTDLPEHTATIAPITCPFTGEQLTAVPALDLDVAIVHAQRADREGNVQMWGLTGVQKEAVLAAKRSLVTVEEIVDELDPRPNAVVLPNWVVDARRRGAQRRPPVLRPRLLRARQRLLPRVGRDQPRTATAFERVARGVEVYA